MDHLPLQVRERHDVVVDDAERADACGGEVEQHRRAETAGADHKDARATERGLSGPSDVAQHDVAGITFQLGVAQHGLQDRHEKRAELPATHGVQQAQRASGNWRPHRLRIRSGLRATGT